MGMSLPSLAVLLLCGLCSASQTVSPTQNTTGTCTAMDDHYRSFDNNYYNFTGSCTYTMAKNCHVDQEHPAFDVEAKIENRTGSPIPSVGRVTVTVYGVTFDLYNSEYGLVQVNSESWTLPVNIQNGKVKLTQSGFSVVLETDFGVMVQYDWDQYLMVTVPGSFAGKVCGLCGNFSGEQEDDLLTTPGDSAAREKSWRVTGVVEDDASCQDECTGLCQSCKSLQNLEYAKQLEYQIFCTYLSSIIDESLKDCSNVIDPKIITDNCEYDLCRGAGMKTYLCDTLQVYTDACQRAGVTVPDWRSTTNCAQPECPENSQYEQCGSSCTSTCVDQDAASKCTASCVETCTCDQGYFRSGDKCVPETQCGCRYQGYYVEAGASFRCDENCTTSCNCSSTGGQVETQGDESCPLGQQCQVVDGIRGCHSMPYANATCLVCGDPHYLTFDGQRYDFQGTCMYQMAGVCSNDTSLEKFDVQVQNDGRNLNAGSVTTLVEVQVYGFTIIISREHPGFVTINGELVNIPVTLANHTVQVYRSGWFAVIETDFGVKVSYDWDSISFVTVPDSYAGAMCGLCGDYNHNASDDLQLKDGEVASTMEELGQSWRTATLPGCVDGCAGLCPECNSTQRDQYATNEYCGLISDPTGPFRDCHAKVEPAGFLQDCLYDVCLYQGGMNMQCKTLTAYAAACQEKGATIYSWRSSQFCDAQCPANGHYELCAAGCPATCPTLTALTDSGCGALCKEGCYCDEGFLFSGDQCVPQDQCGCLYEDRYYKYGQVFFPNGTCDEECTCNDTVECKNFTCGPSEKCDVKNGVRACQPIGKATCSISGDPHYNTFDNSTYDFQGTCTYAAAQACHLEDTSLTPFTVVVENEKWYAVSADPTVSVAKLVAVEVYGDILILRRNEIGMVMVNGVMSNLPRSLHDGAVQIYQDGSQDVIVTDFGLKVTYDLVYHITVTVPGSYYDKTCGLCGNFNNDTADEFQLPDGQATKDVTTFGASWKVAVPGVVCQDGCSGDLCPKCPNETAYEAECSIITDPKGPFATCHDKIDPNSYYRDCVFDICQAGGNTSILCHSIAAYMLDCQDIGENVTSWRTPTFCSYSCPDNSHYQVCSQACASPCPGLTDMISCPTTCTEGCTCDSDFLFNGTGCVSSDQCSCYFEGRTYKIGESVMTDNCSAIHTCQSSGVVLTQATSCTIDENCQVQDGNRGCYFKQCTLKAGGVFTPFGGSGGNVTDPGAYVLVKVCDQDPGDEWFRVVAKMEQCTAGVNSVIAVYIFFDDLTITVNSKLEAYVNGQEVVLPSVLTNGTSVKLSGQMLTVEKTSVLQVSYSLSQEVIITVGESVADKVCGACGSLTATNTFYSFISGGYLSGWTAPDFPQCGV